MNGVIFAQKPLSQNVVFQGTAIPVVSMTQINSDLPGMIKAQVVEDVYDSIHGTTLLIPKGSVLNGVYNSDVKIGQERVMFAFTRLILPNGMSADLGGMPGADEIGQAGATDDVNNHFFKIFGSSLLTAGLSGLFSNNSVTVNSYGGSSTTISSVAGQVLSQTAQTMMQRNQNIQPTITIRPGIRFNVMVNKDIYLDPYRAN